MVRLLLGLGRQRWWVGEPLVVIRLLWRLLLVIASGRRMQWLLRLLLVMVRGVLRLCLRRICLRRRRRLLRWLLLVVTGARLRLSWIRLLRRVGVPALVLMVILMQRHGKCRLLLLLLLL